MIHELQNSQTKGFRACQKFRFAHDANLHQTSNLEHHTLPTKNGLCCFSSATVVIGPCPGQMIVSYGKVRIFSRLFCKASRYDALPPPIEPAKSESPTIEIGRASPVTTYVIPPGECPQVRRVSICKFPSRNFFPSSIGSAPGTGSRAGV